MMNYLKIKEANSKGYAEAYVGDGVNIGASGSHTRRGRVNKGGVNTLTTQSEMGVVVFDDRNGKIKEEETIGSIVTDNSSPKKNNRVALESEMLEGKIRIRKLTPKECWRLQAWGFKREDGTWDDSAFEKAKWKKQTIYFESGEYKCNAKLKVANEKPEHSDMEIYVLCTISDMFDTETLTMTGPNNILQLEQERTQSVNIAITKLEKMDVLECATSITKCIDFMGMPCTVIINPEAHQITDIIVQVAVGKGNTARFMKITTESSWNTTKLFTILTLLKLITELKIFTSTTAKVNMQWSTQNIESFENYTLLKISSLKMEHIEQRVSDSELYKQAGNGCSANVVEAIARAILLADKQGDKE